MTIERVAIPLTIGAAIIGVWVALRKSTPATVVVNQQTPAANPQAMSAFGTASGVGQELYSPDPSSTIGTDAGYGIATNPAYVAAGYSSPLTQAPIQGASTPVTNTGSGKQGTPRWMSNFWKQVPLRYTSQLPPWKNGRLESIDSSGQPEFSSHPQSSSNSGCGCGGSGGCGSGKGACTGCTPGSYTTHQHASTNPAAFLDGSGGSFVPLYGHPTAPATSVTGTQAYAQQWHTRPPNEHTAGSDFAWN